MPIFPTNNRRTDFLRLVQTTAGVNQRRHSPPDPSHGRAGHIGAVSVGMVKVSSVVRVAARPEFSVESELFLIELWMVRVGRSF